MKTREQLPMRLLYSQIYIKDINELLGTSVGMNKDVFSILYVTTDAFIRKSMDYKGTSNLDTSFSKYRESHELIYRIPTKMFYVTGLPTPEELIDKFIFDCVKRLEILEPHEIDESCRAVSFRLSRTDIKDVLLTCQRLTEEVKNDYR